MVLTSVSSKREQESQATKASRRFDQVESYMGEVTTQMREVTTQIGDMKGEIKTQMEMQNATMAAIMERLSVMTKGATRQDCLGDSSGC